MIVHAEIIVTPDRPTVRFRQPREQIDLERELARALATQGWGIGTYFNVQFTNTERTKVLASALFMVGERDEQLMTNDVNDYQTMTKSVARSQAVQIGDWWELAPEQQAPDRKVEWNIGTKTYQVKAGDQVIYESSDKSEAQLVANG